MFSGSTYFSRIRSTFAKFKLRLGKRIPSPKTDGSIPFSLIQDPETALSIGELRAIGRVTVQTAALELDLIRFLSTLLFGNPDIGVSVFLGLNLKSLIDMLPHAFRLKVKTESYDDDIMSLVSALEKLAAERNTIVHGQWHYDVTEHRVLKTKARKTKRAKREQLYFVQTEKASAHQLNEIADLIVLARKVLVAFYQKLLSNKLVAT